MTITELRTALERAEQAHEKAAAVLTDAQCELDAARDRASEDPSSVRVWRKAREKVEEAELALAGATKRRDAAHAALDQAEIAEAHDRLATALDQADRLKFFDRLAPTIVKLARADLVLSSDVYEIDDAEVSILAPAYVEKVEALRAIRRAVNAQHEACAAATAAALFAKMSPPKLREVDEHHAITLAAVERHALTPMPSGPSHACDLWIDEIIGLVGYAASLTGFRTATPAPPLKRDPKIMLEWARLSFRLGDGDEAARQISHTNRSDLEIENARKNAAKVAEHVNMALEPARREQAHRDAVAKFNDAATNGKMTGPERSA